MFSRYTVDLDQLSGKTFKMVGKYFLFRQGNLYETKKEMYTKNLFHQSLNSGFGWPSFLFFELYCLPF